MTKEEKDRVIVAILKQKVANSKKAEMQLEEHRERKKESQGDTILLRIARVATGATVRWKRALNEKPIREIGIDVNGEEHREEAKYESRMLACTRCGTKQETKDMQLKISVGLRAIHCKNSGKQEQRIEGSMLLRLNLAPMSYPQDRPTFPHLKKRRGKQKKRRRRKGKESKTAKFEQASSGDS